MTAQAREPGALGGRKGEAETAGSAFRAGPPHERTGLRDNLEYIAALILIVLVLRQVVVEAFRIQHGSMAPTLFGVHREVRCPNCGYVFGVGVAKVSGPGNVECPNCHHHWAGAGQLGYHFARPAWLWNSARDAEGRRVIGANAANRVDRGPSRIFVNKFVYELRRPRRWEVIVFVHKYREARCPYCGWTGEVGPGAALICPECGSHDLIVQDPKSYIKRVTGLPGEAIDLRDGDVYADGKLMRKPPSAQEHLWFHVFDSEFMPRVEGPTPIWDLGRRPDLWHENGPSKGLLVDARAAERPVTAAYARRIHDFYSYDGLSFQVNPGSWGAPGRNEVGDCRIRVLVRVLSADADDASVVLGIRDAGHDFSLNVGARDGRSVLNDGSLPVREAPVSALKQGSPVWVELENYDDRVVARVDGRLVASVDYDGHPDLRHGVRFGARHAEVSFDRIVIDRDIYYNRFSGLGDEEKVYRLDRDEYFVMGDNCPASSDSRRWPTPGVPAANIIGKAFFIFWPVQNAGFL